MFSKLFSKFTKFQKGYILIGKRRMKVYLAKTVTQRALGLMHMRNLGDTEGMLFTPGINAKHGIWMLNMNFSIDIIWISENGKVVDIAESVKPCNSMFSCPIYKPKTDAFYVLELKAGASKKLKLKTGIKIRTSQSTSSKG